MRLTVLLKSSPVRESGGLGDLVPTRKGHGSCGLARDDVDTLSVDGGTQNVATGLNDGLFDAVPGFRFNQEDHTAAPSGTADFPRKSAIAARVFDDAVDGFRRNRGQVAFAEGPFFAHEPPRFLPIGLLKGDAHGLSYFGDALEALLDRFLAANLGLEDFPIVDAVLAGLAGVAHHD